MRTKDHSFLNRLLLLKSSSVNVLNLTFEDVSFTDVTETLLSVGHLEEIRL